MTYPTNSISLRFLYPFLLFALLAVTIPAQAAAQSSRVSHLMHRLGQASLSICESTGPDNEISPCASEVTIVKSGAYMASVKGEQISVTSHLVDNSTDDELAFVIAHEMAHIILMHPRSTPRNELAADYWAARFLILSGFDARSARQVFSKLQPQRVRGFPFSLMSHPSGSRRMREVERALGEKVLLGIL